MPCSDGGPTYAQVAEAERRRERRVATDTIRDLEALLCSTCRTLELKGYDFALNPALDVWWANHQAQDAVRETQALKARLASERILSLSNTRLIDMSDDDKDFLRKHKVL